MSLIIMYIPFTIYDFFNLCHRSTELTTKSVKSVVSFLFVNTENLDFIECFQKAKVLPLICVFFLVEALPFCVFYAFRIFLSV